MVCFHYSVWLGWGLCFLVDLEHLFCAVFLVGLPLGLFSGGVQVIGFVCHLCLIVVYFGLNGLLGLLQRSVCMPFVIQFGLFWLCSFLDLLLRGVFLSGLLLGLCAGGKETEMPLSSKSERSLNKP